MYTYRAPDHDVKVSGADDTFPRKVKLELQGTRFGQTVELTPVSARALARALTAEADTIDDHNATR